MYKNLIRTFDNTLSSEFCRDLINAYEAHPNKVQGALDNKMGKRIDKAVKNAVDLGITVNPDLKWADEILFKSISEYLNIYVSDILCQSAEKSERLIPWCYWEQSDSGYNMKKYEINEGIFDWHNDSMVVDNTWRHLGVIWYLNDVQDGGYTEFFDGTVITPVTGRLLVFPSTWTFPHRGVAPKSNEKYIITSFVTTSF